MDTIRLSNFQALVNHLDDFEKNYDIDTKLSFNPTGAKIIGEEKGLFIWRFYKEDVEDFINIYSEVSNSSIDKYLANFVQMRLEEKAKDMKSRGICPVECMLYSTKVINKQLENRLIFDAIVNVATKYISVYENEGIEVMSHIIKKWHWIPQLKLAISICGQIRNINLLRDIYYNFSSNDELRVYTFKALMDSGKIEIFDYILMMIKGLNKENEKDKQIANHFTDKIDIYLPDVEEQLIEFYKLPGISSFASKLISKFIKDINKDISMTGKNRKYFKVLADKSSPNAKLSKKEKDEHFEELVNYLNNPQYRKDVLWALRYSHRPEAGDYIIMTLKHNKCLNGEIKEAIMSLGFLKCSNAKDIVYSYINNNDFKVYVWAYCCLIGEIQYAKDIIKEFLENKITSAQEVASVIKQFYKSVPILETELNDQLIEILRGHDEAKKIRAIENTLLVLDSLNITSAVNIALDIMGYNEQKTKAVYSEELQKAIMNLVQKLCSKKIPGKIEKFLFYVMESPSFSQTIRSRAMMILKSAEEGEVNPIKG